MPKRTRPKAYKVDPEHHAALRRRWKRWLPRMKSDLTDLLGKQEMFWDLQEVAKENPKVLKLGSFFDWMCRNYVIAQTVGVRSFMDQSKGVQSLWRMLFEILEHPGVISREFHVRMYKGTPMGEEIGHTSFDATVGRGARVLGTRAVRSDLRRLEDASERIRRFVNKRVAHKASLGELRRLPKFAEVDSALKTIDEVFCKYNLLLQAIGMSTCHAVRQYDWREVLWEPWVLSGGKLRP